MGWLEPGEQGSPVRHGEQRRSLRQLVIVARVPVGLAAVPSTTERQHVSVCGAIEWQIVIEGIPTRDGPSNGRLNTG